MIPTRSLLIAAAAALLTSFALVPTAGAATDCMVDTYLFHADYDCEVAGVGGSGTVHWCPDPFTCANTHVVGCYVYLGLPWYCW